MYDKATLKKTPPKIRSWLSRIIVIMTLILIQGITHLWVRVAATTLIAIGLFVVIHRLAEQRRKLLRIIICDELTGLGNFRAYQERMRLETQRAQRNHTSLCLILIDLDHFKVYNDSYGHRSGNELLYSVGRVFQGAVRSIDGVYRFGGDEFAIILPETDLEQVKHVVKRIQDSFKSLPDRAAVTLSMGMAIYREEPVREFFEHVDHLLYEVKAKGGNGCQADLRTSYTGKGNSRTVL